MPLLFELIRSHEGATQALDGVNLVEETIRRIQNKAGKVLVLGDPPAEGVIYIGSFSFVDGSLRENRHDYPVGVAIEAKDSYYIFDRVPELIPTEGVSALVAREQLQEVLLNHLDVHKKVTTHWYEVVEELVGRLSRLLDQYDALKQELRKVYDDVETAEARIRQLERLNQIFRTSCIARRARPIGDASPNTQLP
jgi:hypothetical protein